MKVTTITPIYNNEKYLGECLKSLLFFYTEYDIEHIFVNDGSTDRSVAILKDFNYNNVKVIDKKYNEGIAAAYRDALKIAKGDIIIFLDADDIAHPDRIELTINAFENEENVGIVYSPIELIDEQSNLYNLTTRLPKYVNNKDLFFQLFKRNFFTGSALAIRNFDWLKSDLDINCCDYYFCMQIAERGYEFKYIDIPLTKYRIHHNNTSSNSEKMFNSFRMVQSAYSYQYLEARWVDEGYFSSDIYSNFGVMEYYYQKNFDKAFSFFLKAEKLKTKDKYTYFYLGCIYYHKLQYELAIEKFSKVLDIDPLCFQAIHNIGIIYGKTNRNGNKALSLLNSAKSLQPYYLLIEKNICLLQQNKLSQLNIISVLTDEDNILVTYCKLNIDKLTS